MSTRPTLSHAHLRVQQRPAASERLRDTLEAEMVRRDIAGTEGAAGTLLHRLGKTLALVAQCAVETKSTERLAVLTREYDAVVDGFAGVSFDAEVDRTETMWDGREDELLRRWQHDPTDANAQAFALAAERAAFYLRREGRSVLRKQGLVQ